MRTSTDRNHYFIVRKQAPADAVPDLIVSGEGVAHVTEADLDFSGRTFRILDSPFQKSCYAMAHLEEDGVLDVVRILRKVYPDISQIIFPKVRSGRHLISDFGTVGVEARRVFCHFLAEKDIALEAFILDPKYLMVIDGPADILGGMIKSGLFDIENVDMLENFNDPEFIEKYSYE